MYEIVVYQCDGDGKKDEVLRYTSSTREQFGLSEKKVLVVSQKDRKEILREKEILYIERIGRETKVQLLDREVLLTSRLEELEVQLDDMCFVRCHNSFLVNLEEVWQFRRTEFVLRNGKCIPISRGYQEKVKEKFEKWARKRTQELG